jgi:hypothetical protein
MRGYFLERPSGACVWIWGAPPPTQGHFSLLVQREVTKRNTPRMARPAACAILLRLRSSPHIPVRAFALPFMAALTPRIRGFGARRCPDARSLSRGTVARLPARDPCGALAQSLAVLGRAIRGVNTTSGKALPRCDSLGSSNPVDAAEHRSRRRRRPPEGVRAGSAHAHAAQGGAVMRAPPSARSAGQPAGPASPGRAFFWSLFFARAKKSDLPWVSHPQVAVQRARRALDPRGD